MPRSSRSRSRSRSRSPYEEDDRRRRVRSPDEYVSRHSRYDRRDRSPRSPRGGGGGGGGFQARENPMPNRCLGVFNLSIYTTEKDLKDVFGEFGQVDKVELVYDRPSGRSRGFGFIYFSSIEPAARALKHLTGTELDGRKIRVDFSMTKRAHSPTPGQYMGVKTEEFGGHSRSNGSSREKEYSRRDSYRDGMSSSSYGGRSPPSSRRSQRYRDDSPPRRRRHERSRSRSGTYD